MFMCEQWQSETLLHVVIRVDEGHQKLQSSWLPITRCCRQPSITKLCTLDEVSVGVGVGIKLRAWENANEYALHWKYKSIIGWYSLLPMLLV